ncbi:MAG: RimK/LysX family protein [Bacteroidota bacterium]
MLATKPKIKLIGRREYVSFPILNIHKIEAKIDTGAYTCSIHCKNIVLKTNLDKPILTFQLLDQTIYSFDEFSKKKIKNSFGEMEERYIIKTPIIIGRKKIRTTVSLSDRETMRYPVLIGRKLLKGKFIVDVNRIYTNGLNLNTLLNII